MYYQLSCTDILIIDCAVCTAIFDDTTVKYNTSNKTLCKCKIVRNDYLSEKKPLPFSICTSILMSLSPLPKIYQFVTTSNCSLLFL